jgi:hypothetical protein
MCYDQPSVQKFRHALTKFERRARRTTNSTQEGTEITREPREKSSKQDGTDIEIGVTTCGTEETFGEARKVLEPSKLQVYVWQIPFMLLTISIILFVVGLNIWVFEAATREQTWGDDRKVQFPSLSFPNILLSFAFICPIRVMCMDVWTDKMPWWDECRSRSFLVPRQCL